MAGKQQRWKISVWERKHLLVIYCMSNMAALRSKTSSVTLHDAERERERVYRGEILQKEHCILLSL